MVSVLMSLLLGVSVFSAMPVYADNSLDTKEPEIVVDEYQYTSSASSTLTISGSTAYCESKLTGLSSVTSISGTQYLEKKVLWWRDTVAEWNASTNGTRLSMSNSKSNISSGTYRLRTEFTVYSGSNSEPVEKISSEITK